MAKTIKTSKSTAVFARYTLATLSTVLLASAMPGCATPSAGPGNALAAGSREEIFVLRSVREERNQKSNWCTADRTGFTPFNNGFLLEDRLTMYSIAVQPQDGLIADAKVGIVGGLHACYGATADPKVVSFYTDGRIAGLTLTGRGDCLVARTDFPEKGITTFRCYLELAGLPAPYVGGSLATNTIGSKVALGGETDPPGYVQSSIATIRLWRAR